MCVHLINGMTTGILKLCFPLQDAGPLIPDNLSSDVPPVPFDTSTTTAVGAIIDVLKYSQKDMDAAVEVVKREVWWNHFQSGTWHSLEVSFGLDYLG